MVNFFFIVRVSLITFQKKVFRIVMKEVVKLKSRTL